MRPGVHVGHISGLSLGTKSFTIPAASLRSSIYMRAMGGNLEPGRRVHLIEQCRPSLESVRMNKTKHFLILITVLLGPFVALMLGQGPTGTLQGRVLDPSGAVIPQAQVSVTSPSGKTVSTTADAAGSYRVPGLAAG